MKFIRYKSASQLPTFNQNTLLDEVDRLFERGFPLAGQGRFSTSAAFPVDVYQDKDSFFVRAELPGFRKENLEVQVADHTLTLSGRVAVAEPKTKESPKNETVVERTLSLPENLDYTKVSASYENGVLTVRLPKREESKPTTVAIEVK